MNKKERLKLGLLLAFFVGVMVMLIQAIAEHFTPSDTVGIVLVIAIAIGGIFWVVGWK